LRIDLDLVAKLFTLTRLRNRYMFSRTTETIGPSFHPADALATWVVTRHEITFLMNIDKEAHESHSLWLSP